MKVKTYGVHGLTEWHGKVKAGSIEVNVSFTGGTASPSGAQPAYFMTKDPIVQFVIENSKEFKNGFIALVMSQDIDGDHPRMAKPKAKEEEKVPEEVSPQDAASENPLQEVLVSDKSDAVAYLKENYPDKRYTSLQLRSKAAFEAACAEHGIKFVFAGE